MRLYWKNADPEDKKTTCEQEDGGVILIGASSFNSKNPANKNIFGKFLRKAKKEFNKKI